METVKEFISSSASDRLILGEMLYASSMRIEPLMEEKALTRESFVDEINKEIFISIVASLSMTQNGLDDTYWYVRRDLLKKYPKGTLTIRLADEDFVIRDYRVFSAMDMYLMRCRQDFFNTLQKQR